MSKSQKVQIIGLNCAGILSKLESFEDLLIEKEPSIFCLQETKVKRPNQIKTDSSRNFTIYELLRKKSNGGGLAIGVHNDLQPVWIDQGDDEVEVLVVEVWVNQFPIRIVNGYGPQMSDNSDRKRKFWTFLEKQVNNAIIAGAGIIVQMDGNSHLGPTIIEGDVNEQNGNGKLFCDFLLRNTHLTLINSLSMCEGKITRMRKTTKGVEKSILDVFIACDKILPYVTKMTIDENRENALTNFKRVRSHGRVIESDHNVIFLNLNLKFSKLKCERVTVFQFKNKEAQEMFKQLTTNTDEFTNCFSELKSHIKKFHTDIKVNKCEVCEIIFEDESKMQEHNKYMHVKDKIIKCEECNLALETWSHFRLHIEKYHSKEMLIKCDICKITVKSSFEKQATRWRETLENYFKKSFKKIRITNKIKRKTLDINILMEERRKLKRKEILEENEEEKLSQLEEKIAEKCEDINKKRVVENFKELENVGDVNHQGIWEGKKEIFSKK